MKMKIIVKIKLLFLCLGVLPNLCAQVTIGVADPPVKGALLQLKDILTATAGGKNSEKGLLMPRVSLVSDTLLSPMFPDATTAEKEEHAGLLVYNLTENGSLKEGISLWTGQEWSYLKSEEITTGTDVKKTLYTDYFANDNISVGHRSLSFRLGKKGTEFYAFPEFKPLYTPKTSPDTTYYYQVAQYGDDNDNEGYGYEVNSKTFNSSSSGFIRFIGQPISFHERHEVWILNSITNDIYNVLFFTIGEENTRDKKIYAVLSELF
ncbi:MAG: hypothetical protein LBB84_12595 [Tannerellaceae bacterium]|nr:hypothetical protein [Tannerellaceae bacterium]